MKLPKGDQVNPEQIINKLITYTLKTDHKDGQHKARLFKSKLGITLDNKDILVEALIKIAKDDDYIFTTFPLLCAQISLSFFLFHG